MNATEPNFPLYPAATHCLCRQYSFRVAQRFIAIITLLIFAAFANSVSIKVPDTCPHAWENLGDFPNSGIVEDSILQEKAPRNIDPYTPTRLQMRTSPMAVNMNSINFALATHPLPSPLPPSGRGGVSHGNMNRNKITFITAAAQHVCAIPMPPSHTTAGAQ